MSYKIMVREEIKIIGIEIKTTNKDGLAAKDIADLFEKFLKEGKLKHIPHKVDVHTFMGIYTNYEEGEKYKKGEADVSQSGLYSYILGAEVSTIQTVPPGMIGKIIPASSYAVFTAKGDLPNSVVDTWKAIWKMSKDELNRSYASDFEIYNSAIINDKKEVDVCVSIKERESGLKSLDVTYTT